MGGKLFYHEVSMRQNILLLCMVQDQNASAWQVLVPLSIIRRNLTHPYSSSMHTHLSGNNIVTYRYHNIVHMGCLIGHP